MSDFEAVQKEVDDKIAFVKTIGEKTLEMEIATNQRKEKALAELDKSLKDTKRSIAEYTQLKKAIFEETLDDKEKVWKEAFKADILQQLKSTSAAIQMTSLHSTRGHSGNWRKSRLFSDMQFNTFCTVYFCIV